MKEYKDREIKCRSCGEMFTLAAGEQKFYDSKELSYPTRCKDCRNAKKTAFEKKDSGTKTMTQEEIEEVLKKWRENTVLFSDVYEDHYIANKKRKK